MIDNNLLQTKLIDNTENADFKRGYTYFSKIIFHRQGVLHEYIEYELDTEPSDEYFQVQCPFAMHYPLIKKEALEPLVDGKLPVGGFYGAEGSWKTKFKPANRLLKRNTEYKVRIGLIGPAVGVSFARYNAKQNQFVPIKILAKSIDKKAVLENALSNRHVISQELVFKTSEQDFQVPSIIIFNLRNTTIISSISVAVNDCSESEKVEQLQRPRK